MIATVFVRMWIRVGLAAAAVTGCGGGGSSASEGASDTAGTTSVSPTSGGGASTDDDVEESESESGSVLIVSPDMGATIACDIYDDECPVGEKCTPYASDGGVRPDATHCIPLAEFPGGNGASCSVQEWTASGDDDCDRELYCVVYDTETLDGTCTPFCSAADEGDLTCDPPATCVGNPDIIPRLCLTDCNPLEPSCPADRGCYRVNDHFVCLDDASGPAGAYGDPCFFTNDCDPSMFCADPPEFFECPHPMGCCTPFCDAGDPEAVCPGAPEHMCFRLFAEGEGPIGLSDVGACLTGPEDET